MTKKKKTSNLKLRTKMSQRQKKHTHTHTHTTHKQTVNNINNKRHQLCSCLVEVLLTLHSSDLILDSCVGARTWG